MPAADDQITVEAPSAPAAESAPAPVTPVSVPKPAARVGWTVRQLAFALFAALLTIYHINGTVMEEGDPVPNLKLPISLLKRGTLTFSPDDFPEMFQFKSSPPLDAMDAYPVQHWSDVFEDRTMAEWRASGELRLNGPRYHLLESYGRRTYVSTFGPIPGITFVPLVAVLRLISPGFDDNFVLQMAAGKLHGALLTAGTAVLLFLTALQFMSNRWKALILAAVFGVATCAWSIQSQNVWQQTVSTFFLSVGIFCFVRYPERAWLQVLTGFAFGTATACRHTGALLLVCVFAYMVIHHRKSALFMALGAAPVPLAIGFYNWYFFGSPFSFGQELVGHVTALEKTGSPDLWQTPFFRGAAGLLFSPSRGLFVFSPFFLLVPFGLYKIFRDPQFRSLRPVCIGSLAIMILQCKWFDWWGGWTYGYRPWLDAVPVLMLCLIPMFGWVTTGRLRPALFGVTVAWATFVQFIGAFTYDKLWNERTLYIVEVSKSQRPQAFFDAESAEAMAQDSNGTYLGPTKCNIDNVHCRYRLWSLRDNIVTYYLTHFKEARSHRPRARWSTLLRQN